MAARDRRFVVASACSASEEDAAEDPGPRVRGRAATATLEDSAVQYLATCCSKLRDGPLHLRDQRNLVDMIRRARRRRAAAGGRLLAQGWCQRACSVADPPARHSAPSAGTAPSTVSLTSARWPRKPSRACSPHTHPWQGAPTRPEHPSSSLPEVRFESAAPLARYCPSLLALSRPVRTSMEAAQEHLHGVTAITITVVCQTLQTSGTRSTSRATRTPRAVCGRAGTATGTGRRKTQCRPSISSRGQWRRLLRCARGKTRRISGEGYTTA